MHRASRSLPVPVSPQRSTVKSVRAIRSQRSRRSVTAGDLPTKPQHRHLGSPSCEWSNVHGPLSGSAQRASLRLARQETLFVGGMWGPVAARQSPKRSGRARNTNTIVALSIRHAPVLGVGREAADGRDGRQPDRGVDWGQLQYARKRSRVQRNPYLKSRDVRHLCRLDGEGLRHFEDSFKKLKNLQSKSWERVGTALGHPRLRLARCIRSRRGDGLEQTGRSFPCGRQPWKRRSSPVARRFDR